MKNPPFDSLVWGSLRLAPIIEIPWYRPTLHATLRTTTCHDELGVNTECDHIHSSTQSYPLYTEFHFLEVFLRLLIPCMIRISTSAMSKHWKLQLSIRLFLMMIIWRSRLYFLGIIRQMLFNINLAKHLCMYNISYDNLYTLYYCGYTFIGYYWRYCLNCCVLLEVSSELICDWHEDLCPHTRNSDVAQV